MAQDFYTENLADFGARERKLAAELLAQPLPDNFSDDGVKLAFNRWSGFVFLVNAEYQCAMMNGDELQLHHSTPYSGLEGFVTDLLDENNPEDLNTEDAEYILQAAENEGADLPQAWETFKEANGL